MHIVLPMKLKRTPLLTVGDKSKSPDDIPETYVLKMQERSSITKYKQLQELHHI